jgi:putative phosphoesterase
MSLRVCILSDTHGHIAPDILQQASRCELTVHAGDIGNGEILDALQAACGEVVAVPGNNDLPGRWPAAQRQRLLSLPERAHIPLPGGLLAVEHGHRVNPVSARHDKLRARHPDARAIVYGHSHRLVVDSDYSPWVLNPGAAGRARTYGGASCLILTATTGDWLVESFRSGGCRD